MSKSNDPRATYITIATRLFAAHGFHGVSLAAMAKDAGVSKQALLHFFGTKERLYAATLNDLGRRLCDEIDAAHDPDPTEHLRRYFTTTATQSMENPNDVQLVIRALLDSDPSAQIWPLRDYLNRLIALVQSTPGGSRLSKDAALAEAYQFIGAVQYFAISLPTIQGIYGTETRQTISEAMTTAVDPIIDRLAN